MIYKPLFAKPGPKVKKVTREKNQDYIKFIHGYACVVCGTWPIHAHHVKRKSQGGSDKTCIPLCVVHHTGSLSVHFLGVVHFAAKFRIDLEALVTQFNLLYDKGAKGPHAHKF
jgi:hypothetical protein